MPGTRFLSIRKRVLISTTAIMDVYLAWVEVGVGWGLGIGLGLGLEWDVLRVWRPGGRVPG
jgi:hypothetical protein